MNNISGNGCLEQSDAQTASPHAPPHPARLDLADGLYVKDSPINGRGLYSIRTFFKGESIYKIQGQLVSAVYDDNFHEGANWVTTGWNEWIAPDARNPLTFTNHACSPNAIVSEHLMVVALKEIRAGEEIVMDYSTTELDPYWEMTCACRSQACRKRLRSFQFLPDTLRMEYAPLMAGVFIQAAQKSLQVV